MGNAFGDGLFDLVFCLSTWMVGGVGLLFVAAVLGILGQRFSPPKAPTPTPTMPSVPVHERLFWWAGTLAAFGGLAALIALLFSFFGAVQRRGLLTPPPASSSGSSASPTRQSSPVMATKLTTAEASPYQLRQGQNKIVFDGSEKGVLWVQSPKLHYQVKLEAGPLQSLLHQGGECPPIVLNWDGRAQDAPWMQKKIGLDFGGKPAEVIITI